MARPPSARLDRPHPSPRPCSRRKSVLLGTPAEQKITSWSSPACPAVAWRSGAAPTAGARTFGARVQHALHGFGAGARAPARRCCALPPAQPAPLPVSRVARAVPPRKPLFAVPVRACALPLTLLRDAAWALLSHPSMTQPQQAQLKASKALAINCAGRRGQHQVGGRGQAAAGLGAVASPQVHAAGGGRRQAQAARPGAAWDVAAWAYPMHAPRTPRACRCTCMFLILIPPSRLGCPA